MAENKAFKCLCFFFIIQSSCKISYCTTFVVMMQVYIFFLSARSLEALDAILSLKEVTMKACVLKTAVNMGVQR